MNVRRRKKKIAVVNTAMYDRSRACDYYVCILL